MYAPAGVKTSTDYPIPAAMKAWVLGDPGQLSLREKPVPVPKKAEVLVRIDAVAIATPVHTHYELALAAIRNGKHVLIEKPLAETSEQARRLIEEAERRHLVLMVDHTFLYTAAV